MSTHNVSLPSPSTRSVRGMLTRHAVRLLHHPLTLPILRLVVQVIVGDEAAEYVSPVLMFLRRIVPRHHDPNSARAR